MALFTPPWDHDDDGCPGPTVEVGREGSRVIVWLRGDHDVSTAGGLGTALDVAGAMGAGDVVVDLAGTTFLDGAIVRVLARRASNAGRPRRLRLRHPSSAVRRVLAACGIDGLVDPAPPEAAGPAAPGTPPGTAAPPPEAPTASAPPPAPAVRPRPAGGCRGR